MDLPQIVDDWIEMEIEKIGDAVETADDQYEIPEEIWPPGEVVDTYEMYVVGSVMATIEWMAIIVVMETDELDMDEVDTTELRQSARERVSARRGEIEDALSV